MSSNELLPVREAFESMLGTEMPEPSNPCGYMQDLIAIDAVENARGHMISRRLEPRDRRGRDIEAACFEDHRHNRQPGKPVMGGHLGRFPQPVMHRQRSVKRAE